MSSTPTYLSCIVDDGKFAIGQTMVQRKKLQPHSFVVGDAYNFTPDASGTTVQGNVVYSASRTQITGSILAKDTFKYTLVLPESSGPFTVGNIMLYLQSDDGTVFPFLWVALKIPYPKQGQQAGTVGNRFVFELIEKLINANDVLAMTILPTDYYSLAGYTSELELPTPSQALFQQFVVHEPKFAPAPFFGMRRSIDNSYWGMPLPFRVGDPFFGVLDGGRAGESKYPSASRFFWGGRLSMPPESLMINYGGTKTSDNRIIGTPLTDKPVYTIGGEPLPANPGYAYP